MFLPEEFLKTEGGRRYIHIHSEEELMEILSYYERTHGIRDATVDETNWDTYPFIFYDGERSIDGNIDGTREHYDTIEYIEWAAMAILQDFEESDKPLSFLFE